MAKRLSARLTAKEAAVKLSDLVPTTWLDSLLTGKDGIGMPPYNCRHVEKLLRGIQDRIRNAERARLSTARRGK